MIKLENKNLKVMINEEGAELTSVWHKQAELEYIWVGDPKYWGRHASNSVSYTHLTLPTNREV